MIPFNEVAIKWQIEEFPDYNEISYPQRLPSSSGPEVVGSLLESGAGEGVECEMEICESTPVYETHEHRHEVASLL